MAIKPCVQVMHNFCLAIEMFADTLCYAIYDLKCTK